MLDPHDPYYLVFRGRTRVFIGSSEHYGAVINTAFNYRRYLSTLQREGFNVTRIFSGQYHERPGKFGALPTADIPDFDIVANTLAPEASTYLSPWRRTNVRGAIDGGNKFDLMRWNPAYFRRLRDFIDEAGRRGIVVELSLFSPYFVPDVGDHFWQVSPWNVRNNINKIGDYSGSQALTLRDPRLVQIQDELVRKLARELRGFDNLYYEICNEPYDDVPLDWQKHVARTLRDAESRYRLKHLIVQEISAGAREAYDRLPEASMIAFHNSDGQSVTLNYRLKIPIIDNETIFGFDDAANRVAAWRFLLSGGALFIGTDYSFTVGHEDGSFVVPAGGAGGGSPNLRRELAILKRFVESLPYTRMQPQPASNVSGLPQDVHEYALGLTGRLYAMYFYRGRSEAFKGINVDRSAQPVRFNLQVPPGSYSAKWIDPKSGSIFERYALTVASGGANVTSPEYSEDITLVLERI